MASINVLVCSGNLGNAQPDAKSLAAWIPQDGDCGSVLQDQKYPLVVSSDLVKDDLRKDDDNSKFDLIVLGLQEATFGKEHEETQKKKEEEPSDESTSDDLDDATETENSQSRRSRVTDSIHSVAKLGAKKANQAAKGANKVANNAAHKANKVANKANKAAQQQISGVTNLAASRDHTKKADGGREYFLSDGTSVLHQLLQDRLPSYKRLLSFQRGEMRLLIYASATTMDTATTNATVKSIRAQNTGVAGLPNKGGIVAEICMGGDDTILSFVTCHLEAHEGIQQYKARCSTLGDILKGTKQFAFPAIYPDVSMASHVCFLMGDLNFRTRYKGHVHYKDQIDDVKELVAQQNWTELNEADELKKALDSHQCLFGFQTLFCNFPPTFKVERSEGYVYKKNRTPSYTDRILWRCGNLLQRNVTPLCYHPIEDFTTSDHKPIRGAFQVQLNEPYRLHECHRSRSMFGTMPWYHRPERENLHIFVSDISCDFVPETCGSKLSLNSESCDSYVTVVSTPEELLLPTVSMWQQLARIYQRCYKRCLKKADENLTEFAPFPHTPIQKNTFNPDWGEDEEIHCTLQAHDSNGQPIDLGGSMLHLFAFKFDKIGHDDELIGSFPVNLEYLFRLCRDKKAWLDKAKELYSLESGMTLHETANHNMVSLDIDGPLLKHGQQTGVIRCSLDAWWVDDGLARAAKGQSIAQGRASNDAHH